MQFTPDWSSIYTAEEAERDLKGFKFTGTGLYLTNNSTMLVLPTFPCEHLWSSKLPKDSSYHFHYWAVPLQDTIFGTRIPTRSDQRDLKLR